MASVHAVDQRRRDRPGPAVAAGGVALARRSGRTHDRAASDHRVAVVTPMRVVVTGGAGFIGSHIVDQLAADGHDVVVLDSLDPAAHSGPPMLCDGVDYRWADVTDTQAWLDALDGADAVCHQAAKVGLG